MDELSRLVNAKRTIRRCPKCGEKMGYVSVHGVYFCKKCDINIKDTYGDMKDLLEENPSLSKVEISMMLGVPLRVVNQYVGHNGVLENPFPDQDP